MDKILHSVNKVYKREHPSMYLNINKKNLKKIINARKNLLLDLKIPKKVFRNSKLIDFGSGSGIYSLVYNLFGAKTDLVEYEKKFVKQSKKLFLKFAKKNTYNIYSSDIFKFKTNKKYDIVIFNGVAHHTKNPDYILDKACKFLAKDGMIIYGIGNKSGFLQRALQRIILFKLSRDENEIIKNSKILFRDHLVRAKKFGGRTVNQIIFDTYINPKINCQSTDTIIKIFNKNKLNLYSAYPNISIDEIYALARPESYRNFKLADKQSIKSRILYSEHKWILNTLGRKNKTNKKQIKMEILKNRITDIFNDKNFNNHSVDFNLAIKLCKDYEKNINHLFLNQINTNKSDVYKIFYKEIINLLKILSKKNCEISDLKYLIKKNKYLFKGPVGVGMNYYVGYKL